jgi:serine/threonine-protein kinase
VELLTTPDPEKGEGSHRWPQFLPGSKAVLFTIHAPSGRQDEGRIGVLSLETGERRVVLQGGTYGRYVPTGHLVYASGGALLAAPFDLRRMQVTGPAVPVLGNVRMSFGGTGAGQFSFSAEGQLVYVPGYARAVETSLVWVDRRGNVQPATAERSAYVVGPGGSGGVGILPDGRSAILAIQGSTTQDLWRIDFLRGARTRLTFEKDNNFPVLSPDGGRVAFSSNRLGRYNLFVASTTGGPAERLTTGGIWQRPTGWSPDGRQLVFSQQSAKTWWDIWVVPLAGDRTPRPLVVTDFFEGGAVFSPDGRWLGYGSSESGRPEVYVRPYSGSDRKWQVSTDGGMNPVWARNGRELFYMNHGRLMAVSVDAQREFRAGQPQVLFSARYREGSVFGPAPYDVTPDGQRFLMLLADQDSPDPQIVYVPDWFDELKARVPGGTGPWR